MFLRFTPLASYARRRLLCLHYVPMYRCQHRHFSLRMNNERIGRCNHYHQQINLFGRNGNRDKGAGYDKKFESTSNQCCHVAHDFINFTVHTARYVCESTIHMLRRRHHMNAHCVFISLVSVCIYYSTVAG